MCALICDRIESMFVCFSHCSPGKGMDLSGRLIQSDLSEVTVSSSKQATGHYHTDTAFVQMRLLIKVH